MSKKRYTLYLSRPLARKFDLVAQQRLLGIYSSVG